MMREMQLSSLNDKNWLLNASERGLENIKQLQ